MIINNVQNVVENNKNLYISNDSEKSNKNTDFRSVLQNKIEEMQANIEAGNVENEPVIQIGGKAFTQEEWEKLLEYVDEVEDETQEAMEVEQAKREAAPKTEYDEKAGE